MSKHPKKDPVTELTWPEWRCIGPHRGGRVVAVAGDITDSLVFYFGACGGGVWKTYDGGITWENVSDGSLNTAAVGAIAVSESDPNVVYVGTGESCIRGNVSHGDGIYRSVDGGDTWTHLGLEDTRHISRIRIHPENPDIAYVAALGHAFGPNIQRGIFRTNNGGKSWDKTLFRNENTGAADLSLDPKNPRTMYASLWQALREPWNFTSGGPGSGLFKSVDSGETWVEITDNPGLPSGIKGRMGIAISPAVPNRVWALIEAKDGGLYQSDDGGCNWKSVNDDRNLLQRPWYYSHIFADPQNADIIWILNVKVWKSTDRGVSFQEVSTPHNDNHDLWIDPGNSLRMIEGNDGGACITFNGGESWSTIYNQPTAQFYHVATDSQFPYRVYGTQQDNSAISVPSRMFKGAIPYRECYTVGTSESGHIAVHPKNPNIIYSGAIGSSAGGGDSLLRYDHETRQTRVVSVWPELVWGLGVKDHKYRFQWTYPITFSPHDSNILYVAANIIFRSDDEGTSWIAISPDLTRNDITKMEAAGGPITLETTSVEHYGTIFSFTESPHKPGVFWTGSDDGLVHISQNNGKTWENITPSELPDWCRIDTIEISPHDPASAYLSATRYKFDDTQPLLYKTNNYGKTWARITSGLPDTEFTRVIRADPEEHGLLYCGTELGVYASFDDGESWTSIRGNFPVVPVTDLKVVENELVASTNGRSFWILGDLKILRQLRYLTSQKGPKLFSPADTYRVSRPWNALHPTDSGKMYNLSLGEPATFREKTDETGRKIRNLLDAGTDAEDGVVIAYHLAKPPKIEVKLTFLDSDGDTIKSFSSISKTEKNANSTDPNITVPAKTGLNRFLWDMRYQDGIPINKPGRTAKGLLGPLASPGQYQVRLDVGDYSETQEFELKKDPRITATEKDFQKQFEISIRIRDKSSEIHEAVNTIRSVRQQINEWLKRAENIENQTSVINTGKNLNETLTEIEEALTETQGIGDTDRISRPAKLNAKLAELATVPASADSSPTEAVYHVYQELSEQIDNQLKKLRRTVNEDLDSFMKIVSDSNIPSILPNPKP